MAAGTAPVPPPPPPIAAAPPPPAAEVTPPEAEADELPDPPPEISYAIVRAMVGAALADGHLSAEEKEMIHKHLGDSNLGEAQTRQIHQDLVLPPSPTDLATETTDPTVREAAYRFASLVILADQEVNDLERRWLDRLAEAYRLGAERKVELEAELFGA